VLTAQIKFLLGMEGTSQIPNVSSRCTVSYLEKGYEGSPSAAIAKGFFRFFLVRFSLTSKKNEQTKT